MFPFIEAWTSIYRVRPNKSTRVLAVESAAIDSVRDAFSHHKAIAADIGGQTLLEMANVVQDASDFKYHRRCCIYDCCKVTSMGAGKACSSIWYIPLLVMDVFEHAYLLDYGLKRADYIEEFFKNIDWKAAETRLK